MYSLCLNGSFILFYFLYQFIKVDRMCYSAPKIGFRNPRTSPLWDKKLTRIPQYDNKLDTSLILGLTSSFAFFYLLPIFLITPVVYL